MMIYNFNGNLIEGDSLSIPLNNRALNYGDGIFETMKFANGRINFWEDHYFRLMAGMRILRMEIPMSYSPEYLEEQLSLTIAENNLTGNAARLKLLVFRKEGGFYTPESSEVEFLITVSPLKDPAYVLNAEGLEVDLFRDFYKQKSLLSTLKTTAATLYTVASIFRNENGLDECLLLNNDKHVVEAISANIFMVRDGIIYTPPLSEGCLKGVMRKQVLDLLPTMNIEVREEAFSPFDLQKADELFLTSTIRGVQWVKKYRKKHFENKLSTELVKRLNVQVAIG